MQPLQAPRRISPASVATSIIIVFIAANVGLALLRVVNRQFNPDEFQHLHIAWLIANGDIIYRDFWEHHGPLYALFNGTLIWLTDAEPGIHIAFALRVLSVAVMGYVGVITWQLARALALPKLGAWLAVAAYAALFYVQNKGIEMRPDIAQTVFWLAGLLVLVRNQQAGSFRGAALAGALFALTILANAKAGVGPFFAVVFYLLAHWLCGMRWPEIRRDVVGMITGGLLAMSPFLFYFALNDAAIDFLYFNYVWNVEFIIHFADFQEGFTDSGTSLANEQFLFFIENQLPFVLLSIAGAGLWLKDLIGNTDQTQRQRGWLFTIVTAGTTLGWVSNQHTQYFLIFLPLLAILSAYALIGIARSLPKPSGDLLATGIAAISAAMLLWYTANNTPLRQHPLLISQKQLTSKVLRETSRDEPIAVYWNQCGGYMFNQHVGYYWVAMPTHSEIIEIISGEHPFKDAFLQEMEQRPVNYVIGIENWMTEGMSDTAMNYVRRNFTYENCLWTRKPT